MKKEELLKNITSFINAENPLAIKEAENLIQVFTAIYEKEIQEFNNKSEEDIEANNIVSPAENELNKEILKTIKKCLEENYVYYNMKLII